MAGLLTRGLALPRTFPGHAAQWRFPGLLAAYSCGGSRGIGLVARTVFPFHPVLCGPGTITATVTQRRVQVNDRLRGGGTGPHWTPRRMCPKLRPDHPRPRGLP